MKKWNIELSKWGLCTESGWTGDVQIKRRNGALLIRNSGDSAVKLGYKKDVLADDVTCKNLVTEFFGENLENGGGCLYVNEYPVVLNGRSSMEIVAPVNIHITLSVPAKSAVLVQAITITAQEKNTDLVNECTEDNDVLVITPDYPSTHNLYLCAFAHSRTREYIAAGLKVQVAAISRHTWYQSSYSIDGVPVFNGRYVDLKKLLSRHQYKVIVVHFVDEYLYPILEGYVQYERMIFICHGPETTFRFLTNRCRQYFTKELPEIDQSPAFDRKEYYVKKFAQKENVEWVFVSEWLRDFSEKMMGIHFKHTCVIYNTINEQLFPYHEKTADDRKKILVIRKFDNIRVHSIDQVVEAIEELSRRDFFNELSFEVYGDGSYYDILTAPLKRFSNVKLHRTFVPNSEIHKLHAENGILLIPSRHDAHAVAMSEGASSGLVVVGSNVTSNGFFMNEAENHTLADPENACELADIIERLYDHPEEFLAISKRMSLETQARCNRENTVLKEVALISEKLLEAGKPAEKMMYLPDNEPVLTIVIPAYNVEAYLEKCIHSMIFHRNVNKTEIIVVNDGSTDGTLKIAEKYEKLTNGVVRVINKENGGHGSTINIGIANAKGKYFRLIDGDDWVDSENLAELVDKLEQESADIVLTKGSYEYVEQAEFVNIIDYDMLHEGTLYHFEDLLYPGYGFATYGPLLTTGNYRTEVLKKAQFKISEKRPYVDMEFNSFALRYVDTVKYYDLDIYRYLIGRTGQTVSRDFWKKKYKDHQYVIFNILKTVQSMSDYSAAKRQYVYEHIIAQMSDSQVFMFDQLCLWEEIDAFFEELSQWPEALEAALNYIEEKNGDCKVILQEYKKRLEQTNEKRTPIIGGKSEQQTDEVREVNHPWKWYLKRAIKACIPYGIMRLYQKERYPNGI